MSRSLKWSLPFRFPDKNPVSFSYLSHVTCPSHLILFNLITLTFGEAYKL